MNSLEAPTTPPPRVPRRTARACKQCRASKIRCSGTRPCDRCARRHQPCVFPSGEPHVSVPERYLLDLQHRAVVASTAPAPAPSVEALPPQPPTPPPVTCHDQVPLQSPASSSRHRLNSVATPASNDASVASLPVAPGIPNSIVPHNPLIARHLSYIRDTKGRPRYLGPTSTWSFCRRALMLLEAQSPSSNGGLASTPLNLDGTAFRLRWEPKSTVDPSDMKNLPAIDYAFYLYNTVKFRLGELFGIIDEAYFLAQFDRFHNSPWETACSQRIWFVEYLFILAYGRAFLAQSNHSSAAPPGSEYAARAMALLPDAAQLHDEQIQAIELLALVALYFQSIDMRAVAYQYVVPHCTPTSIFKHAYCATQIGQAVRLAYVEGIQRHVSDDVVNPAFSIRCNTAWWILYVLDQELTAIMGGPPSIPEADITLELPFERSPSLPAKALTLRIRLSRLTASICNTVYGTEDGLGSTFVRTTTAVLHQLPKVLRDLEDVKASFNDGSGCELPHMLRHIMLSYHHCIILATRPLVMWILILSMPPATMDPQQLESPIAALLRTSAESATTVIFMLKTLAEHDLLETFLPFQLEYAFSAGMLLSIISAILPTYIPNENWQRTIDFILDEMVRKKNAVAPLRRSELEQLDVLLTPLREQGRPDMVDASDAANSDMQNMGHCTEIASTQIPAGLEQQGFGLQWDAMGGGMGNQLPNSNQILELAEQLETGDLLSSFFFDPQV